MSNKELKIADWDSKDDFNLLVSTSFRYCIGRKTYVVSWFVDFILKPEHWNNLQPKTKIMIKRDIEEAKNEDNLGMNCDKVYWEKLYDKIFKEINDGTLKII